MFAQTAFILDNPGVNAAVFLALGGLSAALVSMAKSGFGSGVGLLAVPIMIYACGGDAAAATGIMLPLLILCDYVALIHWRGQWELRQVLLLLPGTVVGIGAGAALLWSFRHVGPDAGKPHAATGAALKLAIGLISLGFVALQLLRSARRTTQAYRPGRPTGLGFGGVAGVTSTLAHAAGPVTAMYLLPQKLGKSRYVATTVLFYWLANQIKLIPYVGLGMIHGGSLASSAVLIPAVIGGALLGVTLHHRIGERSFAGVVYGLLALAGGHLTLQAVRALWLT
ncbi:MAG: sulfite exporter TauE/SafE family protein [Phycisphaerae bacterium]|nr:sulfite exporter TauE/SafE family protein [Phycisphaerae bacterium]